MAEQAGRLEVEVVAQLQGFAEKLKAGVDRAAAGVKAKIGVEIDTVALRERLELAVKEASAGVNAKIGIKFDSNTIRNDLEKALAEAAGNGDVTVKVKTDSHLGEDLRIDTEEAQLEADRHPIEVPVKPKESWFQRFQDGWRAKWAKLRSDAEQELNGGGGGGSSGGGLFKNIFKGLGKLKIPALLSLLQPAIGVIDSLGAGVTVLAAGITQAAGASGAALPIMASFFQGIGTFKIAMGGVNNAFTTYAGMIDKLHQGWPLTQEDLIALRVAMNKLAPAARSVVSQMVHMRPAFRGVRKDIQQAFFSKWAGQLQPLVHTLLPLFDRQLTRTGGILGTVTSRFARFFQTKGFRKDLNSILGTDNYLLGGKNGKGGLGDVGLNLVKILTKLTVAAGPLAKHVVDLADAWTKAKVAEVDAASKSGTLEAFFQRAGDRMGQIYRTVRDFGVGLFNIGSIALGVDDKLGKHGVFGSLEKVAAKFRAWTDSAKGKNQIAQYFKDILPITTEVGHLIREAFDALVRHGTDNPKGLLGALQSLEKIGGVVNGFLTNISAVIGPKLIQAISSFFGAFGAMSHAKADAFSKPIVLVLNALTGIADFVASHKTLADSLGYILGAIVAFKVLKTVGKYSGITSLVSGLGGLGRALRGGGGLRGILGRLSGGRFGTGGSPLNTALGQLVYWREPLPVYIVGGVGPGAAGGPGEGEPVPVGPGGGGPGRPSRWGRIKGGLTKGLGRLLGGATIVILGNQVGDQIKGNGKNPTRNILGSLLGDGANGAGLGFLLGGPVGAGIGAGAGVGYGGVKLGIQSGAFKDLYNALSGSGILGLGGLFGGGGGLSTTPVWEASLQWLNDNGTRIVNTFGNAIIKGGTHWRQYSKDAAKAALSHTELASTARGAGVSENKLITAITGSNGAYRRVYQTLKDSGKVNQTQLDELSKMRDAFVQGKEKAGAYADAHGLVDKAEQQSGTEAGLLSGKFGLLNGATLTVKQNVALFKGKLDELSNSIDHNGTSLDGNTTKGRANIQAVKNAAAQAIAHAQAIYRQTHRLGEADTALREDRRHLIAQATQLGLNKEAVRRLVDQVYNLHRAPGSKKITFDMSSARRHLNSFSSFFDSFMASISGKVANFPTPFQVSGTSIGGLLVVPGNLNVFQPNNHTGQPRKKKRTPGFVNGIPIIGTPDSTGRATGGRMPLYGGMVGENGPEWFKPDRPGSIVPAARTRMMLNRLRQAAGSARGLAEGLPDGGAHVVFQDGAIRITNPVPEKASTSVEKRVRAIGAFGLFGGATI